MTDHPPDTPKSLRALAEELCALSATPDLRLTQVAAALDVAEDALRRAADRLDRVATLTLPLDLPEAVRDALSAWLQDPALVRVNMLRGGIAVPADLVWLHDTNGPVADALAAARRAGAEEMRAAAAAVAADTSGLTTGGNWDFGPNTARKIAVAILALPLPGDQP